MCVIIPVHENRLFIVNWMIKKTIVSILLDIKKTLICLTVRFALKCERTSVFIPFAQLVFEVPQQ